MYMQYFVQRSYLALLSEWIVIVLCYHSRLKSFSPDFAITGAASHSCYLHNIFPSIRFMATGKHMCMYRITYC